MFIICIELHFPKVGITMSPCVWCPPPPPPKNDFNSDAFWGIFRALETKVFLLFQPPSQQRSQAWFREGENQKAGNSGLRIKCWLFPEVICLCAPLSTDVRPPFFSKDLRFFGSTLISCSDSICEIEEPLRDLEHIALFEVWSNFCCSPFDVERMKWGKCTVFASNSAEHM